VGRTALNVHRPTAGDGEPARDRARVRLGGGGGGGGGGDGRRGGGGGGGVVRAAADQHHLLVAAHVGEPLLIRAPHRVVVVQVDLVKAAKL
jgi:hypothetical protein